MKTSKMITLMMAAMLLGSIPALAQRPGGGGSRGGGGHTSSPSVSRSSSPSMSRSSSPSVSRSSSPSMSRSSSSSVSRSASPTRSSSPSVSRSASSSRSSSVSRPTVPSRSGAVEATRSAIPSRSSATPARRGTVDSPATRSGHPAPATRGGSPAPTTRGGSPAPGNRGGAPEMGGHRGNGGAYVNRPGEVTAPAGRPSSRNGGYARPGHPGELPPSHRPIHPAPYFHHPWYGHMVHCHPIFWDPLPLRPWYWPGFWLYCNSYWYDYHVTDVVVVRNYVKETYNVEMVTYGISGDIMYAIVKDNGDTYLQVYDKEDHLLAEQKIHRKYCNMVIDSESGGCWISKKHDKDPLLFLWADGQLLIYEAD